MIGTRAYYFTGLVADKGMEGTGLKGPGDYYGVEASLRACVTRAAEQEVRRERGW